MARRGAPKKKPKKAAMKATPAAAAVRPSQPARARSLAAAPRLAPARTPPKPRSLTRSGESGAYERAVRAELSKKLGPGSASSDVRSIAFHQILSEARRAGVHPRACAGLVVIASGLAPTRMPSAALCCGQR